MFDPIVEPAPVAAAYPRPATLGGLLPYWLTANESAPAITFVGGRSWNRSELAGRVAAAQAHLERRGVGLGDRVAVVCDNSPEMVVALLTIVTSGAVAVPVNTGLADAGVAAVLRNSRPRLVLAGANHMARADLGGEDAPAVMPATDLLAVSKRDEPSLRVEGAPDDIAMIIHSSGTTGAGKGVMLSHRACLTASTACAGVQFEASPDDRVYTCLPLFHCAAQQMGLWTCLISGAELILDRGFRRSEFWEVLARHHSTAFHFIGPMLSMLWDGPSPPQATISDIRLASGGGPRKAWEEFEERFGFPLVECYGMTETFGGCVSHRPSRAQPWTLGHAMDHVEVRVAEGTSWADGSNRGEILIRPRQPGVMFSGYFNDPERTEAAWKGGWYQTGDLGSWSDDGMLRYHSRVDDIIRHRGENISVVELEAALSTLPGIAECAVVAVPSDSGDDDIMAAVVPDPDAGPVDLEHIWQASEQVVARFAIPRFLLVVDQLPKTATERIQRHAIRAVADQATERPSRSRTSKDPT